MGQKKLCKIPAKIPTKFPKFPCEKSKKIHRRASAGAQGESTIAQQLRLETQERTGESAWQPALYLGARLRGRTATQRSKKGLLGTDPQTPPSNPPRPPLPRGPKDQKNSRFRARLRISSENETFERATHRGPIFCGEIEMLRLNISSKINNFDRD